MEKIKKIFNIRQNTNETKSRIMTIKKIDKFGIVELNYQLY